MNTLQGATPFNLCEPVLPVTWWAGGKFSDTGIFNNMKRKTMKIKFRFDGTPLAKKRHRSTKGGHTYNPQSGEEAGVKVIAKSQYRQAPLTGPVIMQFRAVFPRPKSHFGTGRNQMKVKDSSPRYHVKKPDFDNLEKFYGDCLNGIAYLDDAQVIGSSCRKEWSDDRNFIGLVEVCVQPVEN